MRRSVFMGGVCGAVVLLATAIASGAPVDEDAPVTLMRATYVDESRASPASATQPASPTRELPTTIMFPAGAKRPRPLVVLAHGSNGNPDRFSRLMADWARAGYVVAAPRFPRSSDAGGNLVGDHVEQPADVSFVLDRLLEANRTRRSPLYRRIDAERIGLAGLSLGGFTTYGVIFNSCCRDGRFRAAVLMSGVLGPFPDGVYDFRSVPTLLVHGDADGFYSQSVHAYPQLRAPKWFVTVHGGLHAPPFDDDFARSDELVTAVTTAFWDRYLKGERAAARRLVATVDASGGLANLQRDAP